MAELIPVSNTGQPDRIADVIFIHGLNGDARLTWTTPGEPDGFWPGWLGADPELPDVGIWSVGYDVKSSSWAGYTMALFDRARNVLDLLAGKQIGTAPIVFIVHGFGGLVAKQILRAGADSPELSWEAIAAQTRGVVFLATPHAGLRLANWVGRIPLYRPTVSVQELEEHNPQLVDLGRWYRNRYKKLGMKVAVYTETRNVKGVRVVQDGDPYLPGVEAVPLDEDHVSITKPKSDKSQLYTGVRAFIRKCLPGTAVADALAGHQREMPQVREFEGGVFLVRNDQGGIRQFSLHIVNSFAPRLPVALTQIPYWKRFHTETESLYRDHFIFQQDLGYCEIAPEARDYSIAATYLKKANAYLDFLEVRIAAFNDKLMELPETLRKTELVILLLDISTCLVPIKRSLGTDLGGQSFQAAVALSRAIGKWLLDGLHVADLILEDYFQARQRKRDLLGSSTGADLSGR